MSINLPEPYNSCSDNLDSEDSFDSEMFRLTLKNNHTYRQANCYDICAFKHVSSECKCTAGKVYENTKYKKDCLDGVDEIVSDCKNRVLRSFNFTEKCSRFCPLECTSVSYKLTSQAQTLDFAEGPMIPYDLFRDKLKLIGDSVEANLPENRLKAHLLLTGISLNIFYVDLQYEEVSEIPKISGTDLVSDIGGTMGNRILNLIN